MAQTRKTKPELIPFTMDIQRDLGFYNSNISNVCLGKRISTGGFIFKYKKDVGDYN